MFFKIGALKNFANFTGKQSFFNKAAGLQACNFIKRKLQRSCFPVKFAKVLRAPFFTKHLWWLLLLKSVYNFANLWSYFNQFVKSIHCTVPNVSWRKKFFLTSLIINWSLSKPPENIRILWFSDVFRGYKKRTVAGNGLMQPYIISLVNVRLSIIIKRIANFPHI